MLSEYRLEFSLLSVWGWNNVASASLDIDVHFVTGVLNVGQLCLYGAFILTHRIVHISVYCFCINRTTCQIDNFLQ